MRLHDHAMPCELCGNAVPDGQALCARCERQLSGEAGEPVRRREEVAA